MPSSEQIRKLSAIDPQSAYTQARIQLIKTQNTLENAAKPILAAGDDNSQYRLQLQKMLENLRSTLDQVEQSIAGSCPREFPGSAVQWTQHGGSSLPSEQLSLLDQIEESPPPPTIALRVIGGGVDSE